jgi:hypothetical protein
MGLVKYNKSLIKSYNFGLLKMDEKMPISIINTNKDNNSKSFLKNNPLFKTIRNAAIKVSKIVFTSKEVISL